MLKKCSKCLKVLDENEFNWKFKFTKRSYHCKECSRAYVKNHYLNNVDYYTLKARKRDKMIKERSNLYIGNYLQNHPCVDCNESNILVLEFDHRDRKIKKGDIRVLVKNGISLDNLAIEINKCDIRCANCHRIKTAHESNSWKLKFISTRSSTG